MNKRTLFYFLCALIGAIVAGCKDLGPIIEEECTGTYLTAFAYGKIDTVGIFWDNIPPYCKYPINKWDGHIVRRKP